MISIAKLHSNTFGNYHAVRNVLCIIMILHKAIVIEILLVGRFASETEKDY
jgi:hypothetical protein